MIPLEDNVSDIIGKAQRGLRISDTELAEKARVSSQKIRKLREGDFDELALLRIAPVLGLAGRALCELAKNEWHPKKIDERDGLAQFHTQYHGMAVNAYLVWDPASRAAAAFDTGADCSEMVRVAKGSCRGLAASARGNRRASLHSGARVSSGRGINR